MEDKERIEAPDEDVEGHRRRVVKQTDEQSDEAEAVEGHATFARKPVMASDEPKDDDDEDDVEGHAVRPPTVL